MNKYSVVAITASIIIAANVAFPLWNAYAVSQLQLHGDKGIFRFYEFMTGEDQLEICNNLPFFTTFEQLKIVFLFEGNPKGTYTINGNTLFPNSSVVSKDKFTSETFSEAQYLAMHFDTMFQGDSPIRIDPRKLTIDTEFKIMILGIIPYTVTQHYTGIGFYNMLNDATGNCN